MPEVSNNAGNPDYPGTLRAIAARLLAHEGPIYLAAHVDPDGDALGSVLGLSRALRQVGKDSRPVVDCPKYLNFLPERGELHPPVEVLPEDSLLVALDSGDAPRVTGVPVAQPGIPVINIDHHGTNSRYGEIHLVEPGKAAASVIVHDLIPYLGAEWTPLLATPVLTGMITDTGSFRFPNTTPDVLRAAADLVGHGAPLAEINDYIATTPRPFFRLQAEVLNTVEFPFDGLMVTAFVNDAVLERSGTTWEDTESLVGIIRAAEGTQLAVLIKDRGPVTKLSLRSRGLVSAQAIAVECGGGGHVAAAGATVNRPFKETVELLMAATEREFHRCGLLP
ncbi:MAG TPA: bifunctional oligoribonuclease/PAP phosphatase NrnA [Deinococcales bacterium]|nr:bifunctional oligoribonuclease/PAP phosphatase NrnA [Deinococcales bacterium]